jgi:hypothetical protein
LSKVSLAKMKSLFAVKTPPVFYFMTASQAGTADDLKGHVGNKLDHGSGAGIDDDDGDIGDGDGDVNVGEVSNENVSNGDLGDGAVGDADVSNEDVVDGVLGCAGI